MADTSIAITAGSGTSVDTRTEATNGNHRQVVVLGDPSTNAGVAPVDATNGLAVDVKASALPTGAATGAKQDTGNTSLGTIAGAVAGTEMQVDVVSIPTVTVAIDQTGNNNAVDVLSIAAGTNAIGGVTGAGSNAQIKDDSFYGEDVTSGILSVHPRLWDGAAYDRQPGNSSDGMLVNLGTNNDVTVTNPTAANLNMTEANSGAIKTAVEVLDNAISGSEMQVDVVAALPAGTNAVGKLLPPDIDVTTHTNYIRKYYTSAGAVTDGIIWSPAAGKRWHVVSLFFQTSADATITFEDDKSGGDDAVLKGEFKAGSGLAINFGEKYPMASGEDAADLIVTTSAGNIYVTCVGYEI